MRKKWWGRLNTENEQILYRNIGSLHFWIQRVNVELWLAYCYADALSENAGEQPDIPEDSEWTRWTFTSEPKEIKLFPKMPDLPVVVEPEYPLRMLPDNQIKIFKRLPVWISISIGRGKKERELIELPAYQIPRTWFGTRLEGELSYWSETRARRNIEAKEERKELVTCPIWIINRSDEDLDFEKFCFRVERLSIYEKSDIFWADETKIVYKGDEQQSDIIMTGKLPSEASGAKKIAEPRNPVRRSLATLTFRTKSETQFIGRK